MNTRLQNNTINFNGYDAQKLKALYMQNVEKSSQFKIYEELYKIGQQEDIDVFMHTKENLYRTPNKIAKNSTSMTSYWAQDNKTIVEDKNNIKLVPLDEYIGEPKLLSERINIPFRPASIKLEGGNIYLGKKSGLENYIIIGEQSFRESMYMQYLMSKGIEKPSYYQISKFEDNKLYRFNPDTHKFQLLDFKALHNEKSSWEEKTKEIIGKELNISQKNIFIISQPDFHIDMQIRPLEYPYVIVNDSDKVQENLEKLIEIEETKKGKRFYKEILDSSKYKEQYATTQEIKKELEEHGFKPILVAGVYGYKTGINFINAIVNKNQNGLSYISNGIREDNPYYNRIQNIFVEDLQKSCPSIKKVYFVNGEKERKINSIMRYLRDYNGGIHCLCMEQPEFNSNK